MDAPSESPESRDAEIRPVRSRAARRVDRSGCRSAQQNGSGKIAMALSKAQVKKIVLSFPGANESTSYGYPSFKIEKKFFTRLRAEDNSLVLIVGSMDERDMLLEADPKLFHITPHYKDYPSVLARLE